MKSSGKGQATIECAVLLGSFSSEREIRVELPDGREISALVDKSQVIVTRKPSPGEQVKGRVKVSVVGLEDDSAVVDLPQGGVGQGPRVKLPCALLQGTPA